MTLENDFGITVSDTDFPVESGFTSAVYTDQPISVRTAARNVPETPERIREMKSLAYTPEAYWKTSAWLFYQQAKLMEDYSDSFEYSGSFFKFYPTYSDLDTEQLRGYFSWRTKVRAGECPDTASAFVYIYAFELLNGIGVPSPEDAVQKLIALLDSYSSREPELSRLIPRWLEDLCAYEQLDPCLIDDTAGIRYDKSLLTLMNCGEANDDELFDALTFLSSYNLLGSRFYISYPDEFKAAAVRSFRSISEFTRQNRKNSLCEKYFGHITETGYKMFESAVFYDRAPTRTFDHSLNEIHSYTCRNGVWRCRKFYGSRGKNTKLGEFMRTVDYIMREKYDFRFKLTAKPELSKYEASCIVRELEAIGREEQLKKAMRIDIDVSKLAGIRASADITRDKLIVEEEAEEPQFVTAPAPEKPAPEEDILPEIPQENEFLTAGEKAFLSALLEGGDWAETARKCGVMPSLLADSINEKLFDEFSDTVIDFSADAPEIIQDYAEDIINFLR